MSRARCLVALIALLLAMPQSKHPFTAYASGNDEDVWQGTITITQQSHSEEDKTATERGAGGAVFIYRHAHRDRSERTSIYSSIRAAAEPNADPGNWVGPAHAVTNVNEYTYSIDEKSWDLKPHTLPSDVGKEEKGSEATIGGSSPSVTYVRFSRLTDPEDHKTTCSLEADFDSSQSGRPPDIQGSIRTWGKSTMRNEENGEHMQKATSGGHPESYHGLTFACDPAAKSYSGEHRETHDEGRQTIAISWNLHYGAGPETEVELIPPNGYDQWAPQAKEDEKTIGNYIDVRIVAHKKGQPDVKPPKKVLRYKIELADTSKEKGVDLNWPENATAGDFDMKIDKDNGWITVDGDKAQSAKTRDEYQNLDNFMVTVNSYDWGGHTQLRVTAELDDHSTVVGHVRGHSERESLAIPKDDNHNHIADGWEARYKIKNPDESADDDPHPIGDGTDGDGIALYDEYRGFHIHGYHERLSPGIKDLFVWDADDLGGGMYEKASGVRLHLIYRSERSDTGSGKNENVVTPNGSHGKVYAVWLHDGGLDDGGVGETEGGPSTPINIHGITIDTAMIRGGYGELAAVALPSTIAHELGHATNVWHHGGGQDYATGDVKCRRSNGTVRNYLCSSKGDKGEFGGAMGSCYQVAAKGGAFSGNDQCFMRYDKTNLFEDPAGVCEWQKNGHTVRGSKYGTDTPGATMCTDPKGTGVNDPSNPHNKAGDSTSDRATCLYRFRIKN